MQFFLYASIFVLLLCLRHLHPNIYIYVNHLLFWMELNPLVDKQVFTV